MTGPDKGVWVWDLRGIYPSPLGVYPDRRGAIISRFLFICAQFGNLRGFFSDLDFRLISILAIFELEKLLL